MLRAAALVLLMALVHTPLMAEAGVYDLPTFLSFCDATHSALPA